MFLNCGDTDNSLENPLRSPTDLVLVSVSPTEISLTWKNRTTIEDGIKIERSTDGTNFSVVHTANPGTTSWNNTGLTENTNYYYKIYAYKGSSSSSYVPTSITFTPDAPTAPTNLQIETVSDTQLNLTWTDNSSNEDGFQIERSTDGDIWSLVHTTAASANSWNNTGLNSGTAYYYRVRAYKDSQYSDYATSSITYTKPAAPTNFVATPEYSSVNLSWEYTGDGVRVQRCTDNASWSDEPYDGPQTSYIDSAGNPSTTPVEEGVGYYYRIYSYIYVNGYDRVISSYTTIPIVYTQMRPPLNLNCETVSESQINLSWADNSDYEDGYKIERSLDNSDWSVVHTTAANVNSWNNTGLSEGTGYYYRVRAYRGDQYSTYATSLITYTKPAAPTNLASTGYVEGNLDGYIPLTWTDNSSKETIWSVEGSTDELNWETFVYIEEFDVTSCEVPEDMDNGGWSDLTTYYFRVSCYKDTLQSEYAYCNVQIPLRKIAAFNLELSGENTDQPYFYWATPSNWSAQYVEIQYSTNQTDWTTLVNDTPFSQGDYLEIDVPFTGTVYFKARAIKSGQYSDWTDSQSLVFP